MTTHNQPDFERIMQALNCEEPDRVPLGEWSVDILAKEGFLNKKIENLDDEIEFWVKAGFDFVPSSSDIMAMKAAPDRLVGKEQKTQYGKKVQRRWVQEHSGLITNWDEFEQYQWPSVDDLDLSKWDHFDKALPAGMKNILICGRIMAPVWMYMGTETFYYALQDNQELLEALFEKIGAIQLEIISRVIEHKCAGAILINDDIAHNSGLMIHPSHLEKFVFPFFKKIGALCAEQGLGYIFHSDGDCSAAMDQIVDCGFKGFNPIQPNAMNILEVKEKWGKKLCLIGNINLDSTLTLGTPQDVRAEVHERIRTLAPGGGYLVASSNSITDYVPLENMKSMISSAFEFGRYPINLVEGEVEGKVSSYQAGKKGKEVVAASDEQLKEYSELLMKRAIPQIIEKISADTDAGAALTEVISQKLIPAMTLVGALYQAGKIFIPEMMISANTMSQVLNNFKEQLTQGGGEKQGVVVIGTVKGDLHDIGKNLVSMMLEGQGFKVVDLGVSVTPEKFLRAVEVEKPDILALSALLTTTMVEMENTIEAFKKHGLRDQVKILIGGAPVTQAFADQIGADGYAYDAPGAALKCKELLNQSK